MSAAVTNNSVVFLDFSTLCGSSSVVWSILVTVQWESIKWKNHFSEMKGDVGMSVHEKEGEQEDA